MDEMVKLIQKIDKYENKFYFKFIKNVLLLDIDKTIDRYMRKTDFFDVSKYVFYMIKNYEYTNDDILYYNDYTITYKVNDYFVEYCYDKFIISNISFRIEVYSYSTLYKDNKDLWEKCIESLKTIYHDILKNIIINRGGMDYSEEKER